MSCKDCIHCEACERMISDTSKMFKALLSEILKMNCDIKYDSTNILSGAEICQCFQDRSRFLKLPYSLSEGDKLKYIFTDENNEIRIGDDWEVVTKICKDGFFVTGRLNSDGTYQAGDCFYPWSAIGTEYFLTK